MGNIELLKKTKAQILAFPEKHDQGSWHCETTMCIAGHASVLAGASLRISKDYFGDGITELVDEYGAKVQASWYASDALDLTENEANYLFLCMDNAIALQRIDQIIELWEKGLTLDEMFWDDYIFEDSDEQPCGCGCE